MKPRKSFPLRIEPRLYEELEAWAQQDLRSVNGQIEYLLKLAVQNRKKSAPPQVSPTDQAGSTDGHGSNR